MNRNTPRHARSSLILLALITLTALASALQSMTVVPTTLVGTFAVRVPVGECRTARQVTSTVALTVTLRMDRQGRLGLHLRPTLATAVRDGSVRDTLTSVTLRRPAVVDTSANEHRPVGRFRFGMMVAWLNLPC